MDLVHNTNERVYFIDYISLILRLHLIIHLNSIVDIHRVKNKLIFIIYVNGINYFFNVDLMFYILLNSNESLS